MKIPEKLQKGDTVAIVATARKVKSEELDFAVEKLGSAGLKVVLGKSIGVENHQFAGSDQIRAEDFQSFLDDPEIKAIWCARGGYGTVRILDMLDFTSFQKKPKWIIGYSDVTALHAHIQKLGIATLHAEMPVLLKDKSEESWESLLNVLNGKNPKYSWKGNPLNRAGKTEGILLGGNLSVLYSLCGSNSVPDMNGKVLFIEDLDEYLYHIDRMMQNLKRNDWFNQLAGLMVGGMSDMHDNTIPFGKNAEEIIADTVKEYDFPVAFNFPAGHLKDNRALIFGKKINLKVSENESHLTYL